MIFEDPAQYDEICVISVTVFWGLTRTIISNLSLCVDGLLRSDLSMNSGATGSISSVSPCLKVVA